LSFNTFNQIANQLFFLMSVVPYRYNVPPVGTSVLINRSYGKCSF
jgi:hypothetical protein